MTIFLLNPVVEGTKLRKKGGKKGKKRETRTRVAAVKSEPQNQMFIDHLFHRQQQPLQLNLATNY